MPRFSTHPAIAVSHLQPHAYGNVFNDRAKVLFGSMLGVPSRETVMAFVLLSHVSFANGMSSRLARLARQQLIGQIASRTCGCIRVVRFEWHMIWDCTL